MSVENRSAYSSATVDPESILHMQPVMCDFGRFANPSACRPEVIVKSAPPPPPPPPVVTTYVLTSDKSTINEGETVVVTITATNANVGDSIAYTVTGINASDLTAGSLSGSFTLNSSYKDTISFTLKNDVLTEGSETLRVSVTGSYVQVVIRDTSIAPLLKVYYGNGLEAYSAESSILVFPSKDVNTKVGSYSFLEAGETEEIVYKWIFINKNLGEVTDLTKFKVGTFSANMISKGLIGNYYAYRTNEMSFGAVTITLN